MIWKRSFTLKSHTRDKENPEMFAARFSSFEAGIDDATFSVKFKKKYFYYIPENGNTTLVQRLMFTAIWK